jgi:hypothetical protein
LSGLDDSIINYVLSDIYLSEIAHLVNANTSPNEVPFNYTDANHPTG